MSDRDYLIKGEMYQYNLGWLIEELMSFKEDLATAIDLKTIKYADPIQWDITTQYPANTVVVDPKSGTAYMSKVPVPAGVELDNANYWVVVFNYQDIYNKIMDGVAFNDRDQDYATKDLLVNDLVWYAGDLYRVIREIPTGSKYIPETNLIKTSIESLLASYYGRDRTAQVSNDTVNVSGDYTLIAGDIAETSTNRTIKVTKDREVNVDGADSLHIDGASTVNVGGLRTEVYAGDKTEGVTGKYTGKFGSASFETSARSWEVKFPDKTVDLHDVGAQSGIYDVTQYGADPTGIVDSAAAFNAAIATAKQTGGKIFVPAGTYRLSDFIITDGDYVYADNGTYTGKNFIWRHPFKQSSFASHDYKFFPLSAIGEGTLTGMQGGCYVSAIDAILIGFMATSTEQSLIVKFDKDFTHMIAKARLPLGHCNDMTYNPKTGKVYVSIYDLGDGIVGVLDPMSLTAEARQTITGAAEPLTMVTYDADKDVYYMLGDKHLFIVNSDFVTIKSIPIDKSVGSIFVPNANSATQGSDMINGAFTALSSIANTQICTGARLIGIDYETGNIAQYTDYPVFHQYDEPESLVAISKDLAYIIGYDTNNITVRPLYLNENGSTVEDVGASAHTRTEINYYVNESLGSNGDGLTAETAFNDLEYAMKMARFNTATTITLVADTVKTNEITFPTFNGYLEIKGSTKTIKCSRPLRFQFCHNIWIRNLTFNANDNRMLRAEHSEIHVADTVTFVGSGTTTNSRYAIDVTNAGIVIIENSIFNNCDVCLRVGNGGYATLWNASGTGNNLIYRNDGGLILGTTIKPNATTISMKNQYGGLTVLNMQEIPSA